MHMQNRQPLSASYNEIYEPCHGTPEQLLSSLVYQIYARPKRAARTMAGAAALQVPTQVLGTATERQTLHTPRGIIIYLTRSSCGQQLQLMPAGALAASHTGAGGSTPAADELNTRPCSPKMPLPPASTCTAVTAVLTAAPPAKPPRPVQLLFAVPTAAPAAVPVQQSCCTVAVLRAAPPAVPGPAVRAAPH